MQPSGGKKLGKRNHKCCDQGIRRRKKCSRDREARMAGAWRME